MLIQKKKRVICIGMMLVLTAFVGMTTNVSATGLPPVAEAGGPYFGYECDPAMIFDASDSYDPEGATLQYRWKIGDDPWTFWDTANHYDYTFFDDFSGTISLEVSDGDLTAMDTADVTISNVPPYLESVDGPMDPVNVDEEITILVSFFDGAPDPRVGPASRDTFLATFIWGDGSDSDPIYLGVEQFMVSDSYAYSEPGVYEVIISIVDDDLGQLIVSWQVIVVGYVHAGQDGIIDEGSEFISDGFLDDEIGTYTAQVDYGDGTGPNNLELKLGNTFDLQHQYCDNGIYTILVTAFNEGVVWGLDVATVTVNNVAPTIESMSGPPTVPIQLGTSILLTGEFSDPGCLDWHVATIDWGDGETSLSEIISFEFDLVPETSHIYDNPGVYLITLMVTDKDGDSDTMTLDHYVVVYDTSAGFVTGGGWIIVQPGSYPADPTLSGKATFGFVSKYKKGQNIPEGNTEFQFHVANLNFHSHTYEWLVVAGSKAMYKGVGTINGAGNYGFKLTAIDGQKNGGGGIDKFRMKIWDKATGIIVYDNQLGAEDTVDPTTTIGGGSIVIHK